MLAATDTTDIAATPARATAADMANADTRAATPVADFTRVEDSAAKVATVAGAGNQ
jgi:hypothetical protein